jgi:ethanolamine utilization protein EutQ (cupin superfamily)
MSHPGLRVAAFDTDRLRRETMMLGGQRYLVDWAINEPSCCAGFIEWDQPTDVPYPFPHNEVHYAISGRAEYTFTYHPFHMDQRVVVVEAGTICLIRFGSSVSIRPLESPYRVVYVVMPMPETPYEPDPVR